MSKLESDAARALGIFEERKKITTREEKLAQYIGDIDKLYHFTFPNYPTTTFMERGIQFELKSIYSRSISTPSIDLVISIGIADNTQYTDDADMHASIRAEYYAEDHTENDKPIITQAFILGKHQVGVAQEDKKFSFLQTRNVHVDDYLEYIREAISAVSLE